MMLESMRSPSWALAITSAGIRHRSRPHGKVHPGVAGKRGVGGAVGARVAIRKGTSVSLSGPVTPVLPCDSFWAAHAAGHQEHCWCYMFVQVAITLQACLS